jgi:hypothetical protein
MVKMPPKKPVAATGVGATPIAAIPAKTEVVQEPVTLMVRRTYATSGEVTGEETENSEIEVQRFLTDTARVSATASYKRNMGNYESAEVRYTVSLPCYVEEIADAFIRANDLVNEQLTIGLEALGEPVVAEDGEAVADEDEPAAEAEDEATDEAEEEGLTEEDIQGYDYEQLSEIASGNPELGVDPEEFPDNPKGLAKFRTTLWEAILASQEGEEASADDAAAADDEGAEVADDAAATTEEEAFEPYTMEDLKAMTVDDLKELATSWELEVKVPRGAKDKGKGAYIKAIWDRQSAE